MSTFGVYVICQNEEGFIRQCIEYGMSLKPDQFVIVDGGSADKTLEIIKEYPQIELFENPMPLDFSAQRNFALSKMKTDWVLHIDADENYAGLYPSKIKELMNVPEYVIGYSFPTVHLSTKQGDADPHVRFFRNLPSLKYHKETCEWLRFNNDELPAHPCHMKLVENKYSIIYNPDIFLIHWAYRKSPTQLREKSKNYMKFNQSHGIEIKNPNELIGKMDVIYVLEDTGLCGGHKIVFEHANRLKERGWNVRIFALADRSQWFPLKVKVECFHNYNEMKTALSKIDAIKIATWHKTAPAVASSLNENVGFYFIQDIETSFYNDQRGKDFALKTYDLPLIPICEALWVKSELEKMGKQPEYIGIGVDEKIFYPRQVEKKYNNLFYIDRNHKLKDINFFREILVHLPINDFNLITVGLEPPKYYPNVNHAHLGIIDDNQMAELYSNSLCYILTSSHEGFCLPALESMACGCPVVCRKADGNMEHCTEDNVLLCNTPKEMADAIIKLYEDESLRNRLSDNGLKVASGYQWDRVIDKLETVLKKY